MGPHDKWSHSSGRRALRGQRKQTGGEGRAAPPGREDSIKSEFQLGLKWLERISQLPVGKDIATENRKLEVWALSM